LRYQVLAEKAKELGLFKEGVAKLVLATRIYCKDPNSLEELHKYQQYQPKRSTFGYMADNEVDQTTLDKGLKLLPGLIEKNLSDADKKGIGTLEGKTMVGDELRMVVNVDREKFQNERPKDPKFPGRKGSHYDYPLRRIIVNYNRKTNVLRVSAMNEWADKTAHTISPALFGKEDSFAKQTPDAEKAHVIFTNDSLKKNLQSESIRVTELELRQLPLKGSPSRMLLEGDDLIETINQLEAKEIKLIGANLSQIASLRLELNGKKIELDIVKGNVREIGNLEPAEKITLEKALKKWGIYRKLF
jgi:hypothetical protein